MASSSFSARTSRLLKLGSVTTTMHVLATGLGHRNSGSASVHRGPSPECRHLSVILPWGVLARPPSGKTRRPVTQVKKSCSLCCGKCCSSPRIDLRRNVAWINRAKAGSAPVRGGRGLGWGLSAPEQLARRRAGEIRLLRHCRVLVAVGLLDLGLGSVRPLDLSDELLGAQRGGATLHKQHHVGRRQQPQLRCHVHLCHAARLTSRLSAGEMGFRLGEVGCGGGKEARHGSIV